MLRHAVLRTAFGLRTHRLMHRFHRDRLVVLMYHGFTADTAPRGLQNLEGNHVHVEAFVRQVAYLREHHNVVSLQRVVEAGRGNAPLPPYPAVITMDDGYRSNYTLAFPVLRRFQVPAAVFVSTGFVEEREPLWPDRIEWAIDQAPPGRFTADLGAGPVTLDLQTPAARRDTARAVVTRLKRIPQEARDARVEALERSVGTALRNAAPMPALYEPLGWDEIRAMQASGLVEIGNHTHRHRILSRCEPEVQRQEIERAHRILETRTGSRCTLFCYPNGAAGDWDATTQRILRDLGYACAPTTIPGYNDAGTDRFELRRVAINARATFEDFLMILYGGLRRLASDLGGGDAARPRAPHPGGEA